MSKLSDASVTPVVSEFDPKKPVKKATHGNKPHTDKIDINLEVEATPLTVTMDGPVMWRIRKDAKRGDIWQIAVPGDLPDALSEDEPFSLWVKPTGNGKFRWRGTSARIDNMRLTVNGVSVKMRLKNGGRAVAPLTREQVNKVLSR